MFYKIKNLIVVCLIGVITLGFGIGTDAAFNPEINYQGKLVNPTTNIEVPDGNYNMEFRLCTVSDCSSGVVWTETCTSANRIAVSSGLFSHLLGSVTSVASLDFNRDLWLGVNIGGTADSPSWDGEMTPRKKLGAVPAAFEAAKLGGKAETAFGTLSEDEAVTGTWTFSNLLNVTEVPTGAGVGQGSLYINPASAIANYTLLGLAVNGSEKFRLDADGDLTISGDATISGGELYLTGISSSSSTTEGTLFYDTDDDQLKVYANGKWQADRTTATVIVGTSNVSGASRNYEKADYICDGTADDVQINAAITALPTGGGIVCLLEGTYTLSQSITITKDNVIFMGVGTATLITIPVEIEKGIYIVNKDNITIKNLKIETTFSDGIMIESCNYIIVENCDIDATGNGLFLEGTYLSIFNNKISGGNSGIRSEFGITYSIIKDNSVTGNIEFADMASKYNTISGNYSNISIASASSENTLISNKGSILIQSDKNKVSGNDCSKSGGNGDHAIQVTGFYNTIDGNYCHDSGDRGIYINSGDYNVVSNNVCEGNGKDGILLYNGANYNTVIGNVCHNNVDVGILLEKNIGDDGNHYNTIIGNICYENQKFGIALEYSDGNVVNDNNCYKNNFAGIWLTSSSDNNTISGNVSINNGQAPVAPWANDDDGIKIHDSTYNIISDNRCSDTQGTKTQEYGIEETGTSDNNTISDNDLRGNKTTDGLLIVGAATSIAGNRAGAAGEGLFAIETDSDATLTALTVVQSGSGTAAQFGGGTDYLQISNTGNITFTNAAGSTITGPSAGTLAISAGTSQALNLTSNLASTWKTTSADLTIQTETSGNLALTSSDALTATYSGGQIIGTGTNAITLGNSGDTLALTSSNWAISTTGDMTGISSIDQGLVAWWPLDDDALDKSGQSNDGGAFVDCGSTVTDIDGNVYNTVRVGTQCWMKENMRTIHYPGGGAITKGCAVPGSCGGTGALLWGDDTALYSCPSTLANLTVEDCPAAATLGMLYQWSAAMNGAATCNGTADPLHPACSSPVQGICPDGWHIPSHYEWTQLERQICGDNSESDCLTEFLYDESTTGWKGNSEGSDMAGNVTDENWSTADGNVLAGNSHFSNSDLDIAASGYRYTNGNYSARSYDTYLWSSTESGDIAWTRYLYYTDTDVSRSSYSKAYGFSVRCLKD